MCTRTVAGEIAHDTQTFGVVAAEPGMRAVVVFELIRERYGRQSGWSEPTGYIGESQGQRCDDCANRGQACGAACCQHSPQVIPGRGSRHSSLPESVNAWAPRPTRIGIFFAKSLQQALSF